MDNSFVIYDDISLNDELLHDLELCGESNFVWNLEPPGQLLFSETLTTEINKNDISETVPSKNYNYFNITPSCSSSDYHDRQSQDESENALIPKDSAIPLSRIGVEEKQEFKCSICGKRFAQQSSCNRHKREQHLQPEKFQCLKCGLRFSKKFNLQTHQKRAHAKDKNGYKCPICSCVYTTTASLKKHIKDYHCNENQKNINSCQENDPQQEAENALMQLKLLQKDIEAANTEYFKNRNTNQFKGKDINTDAELTSIDEANVRIVTLIDRLYPFGETQKLKVQQITRNDNIKYFVCEFCSKEFRKTYGYLRHRRIHFSIRPFVCVICKKAFATQNQLKSHTRKHTVQNQDVSYKGLYKCPKCFDITKSVSLFDEHLRTHLPDTSIVFKCCTCNKAFTSLDTYFRHKHKTFDPEMNMLKTLLPPPLCSLDNGNKFSNVSENILDLNNTFTCSLCGLKMSSDLSRKQHEKRHRNLRKYQCNICNGFYASKSSLKVHMRIHLNQCNFKCSKCQKHFRTNFQLRRHQLRHSNAKIFKCRYCNELFKSSQYCRSHMMTHLKNLIKTKNSEHEQQIMSKLISIPTLIQNPNKKEIIVKDLKILKKNSNRKKEIENISNNKHPYQCKECPLKFRYNAWLRKHQAQAHAEERPYRCEICEKSFRKNQTLKSHLLTHNPDRLKETCLVCGKKYTSEKSLKVHLRLHTEEKPFQCELCKKMFRTSGHLIQHRNANHK